MAVEVVQDSAATVALFPDGSAPASATAVFYGPTGGTISAPAVTIQSVGSGGTATVGTVTDQTTITVDDATGISAGDRLWYTSVRGWEGAVLVSEVDSLVLTLESPPPGVARVGDTLKGLRCTVSLTADDTDSRERNHRVQWLVTGADGAVRSFQTMVHVVRTQFSADQIVSASDAAGYLASTFPAFAAGTDGGHFAALASRAANRVLRVLRATGNYPHLVGDRDAFADSGLVSLRIECAMTDGLVPAGYDPAIYVHEQERHLAALIGETVSNLWVDHDDDGVVDEDAEVSRLFAVTARRL